MQQSHLLLGGVRVALPEVLQYVDGEVVHVRGVPLAAEDVF
jgi:hypothetical protein